MVKMCCFFFFCERDIACGDRYCREMQEIF